MREWLPWFALLVNGFGNKIMQTSKSESEHSLRMGGHNSAAYLPFAR